MNNRIYFKDGFTEDSSLVGIVKNRPTGLVICWLIFSLILIYKGIFSKGNYWFLLVIGFVNLFSSLFVFAKVKQYTAIRVYKDKLILTDHKELDAGTLVKNEEIRDWVIEGGEGNSLIINLHDGDQIHYRITQGSKVNDLLMKTIGNKEKNEQEMQRFRENADKDFIGIKDVRRLIKKRNDQDEKKH